MRERPTVFRASPYLTPVVLVLLLAAAAGLFAGSYTAAMANPTPHRIPSAVVGDGGSSPGATAFVRGLEETLDASLDLRRFSTYEQARDAVEQQQVFAILDMARGGTVHVDLSGAVSWPLLPSPLGEIGRWLPPGASVNAQHTAVYFAGYQHAFPYLVLAGWAVLSTAVFWNWRHRHPAAANRPRWRGDEP